MKNKPLWGSIVVSNREEYLCVFMTVGSSAPVKRELLKQRDYKV